MRAGFFGQRGRIKTVKLENMVAISQNRSRLRRQLAVIAVFSFLPLGLYAGPLSRTSKSIDKRTSSSSRSGSGGSSSRPRNACQGQRTRAYYDTHRTRRTTPTIVSEAEVAGPPVVLRPKVDFFVGLQSVKGSDYAGDLRFRVHQGPVGFGFTGSRYMEQFDGPGTIGAGTTMVSQGQDVSMDVWSFDLHARLARDQARKTSLWLRGGLTGLSSTDFAQIYGPTVAVEINHRFSGSFNARGSARQYWFDHDVSGREYRAEVSKSGLSLAYRVLRFNVGESLHGPMVGLRTAF